jgi:hypothetical protein
MGVPHVTREFVADVAANVPDVEQLLRTAGW